MEDNENIEETATDSVGPTAEARAETAERKLAFIQAGVDIAEGGSGELLLDAYKGELNSESIREEAIRRGIMQAPVVDDGPDLSPEETQSTDIRRGVTAGGSPSDGSVHPSVAAADVFAKARDEGLTREDAMVQAIRSKVGASIQGDRRTQPRASRLRG